MSVTHTEDLIHFFRLKKELDPRVRGITFDQFVEMKYSEERVFDKEYDIRAELAKKKEFL